jgi:hypothetical protein
MNRRHDWIILRFKHLRQSAVWLTLSLLVISPPADANTYFSEPDFGFKVTIPDGLKVCTTPAPGANHGLTALLVSTDCEQALKVPRLELFVDYNVTLEAETAESLIPEACNGRGAERTKILAGTTPVYRCRGLIDAGPLQQARYFLLHQDTKRPSSEWAVATVDVYDDRIGLPDLAKAERLISAISWVS